MVTRVRNADGSLSNPSRMQAGGSGGNVLNRDRGVYNPQPYGKVSGYDSPWVTDDTGLSGEDRNAQVAIESMLKSYGLESLAGKALSYIQQGYSADTIMLMLQQTDEYKRRFAGNEERKKKGMAVLSPAEYLSVESSYRQIMRASGLPEGFYDNYDDFTKLIGADVSPTEVQGRVESAVSVVQNLDPNVKNLFNQWYTDGDIVAYALDPEKSATLLKRQARAANVGGIGMGQGFGVNAGQAERIGDTGVTDNQARSTFGWAGQGEQRRDILNSANGGDLTKDDLIDEGFFSSQSAAGRRNRLASQERAQFNAQGGLTSGSLSRRDAGRI